MIWSILAILLLIGGLLLVPLGLPGTWLMVGVIAVATYLGEVALLTLVLLASVAAVGEAIEWVIVKRYSVRYGGSRLAFWGAVVGGLVGVFVGVPVPVVGPIIAGAVGSFAGAAVLTLWETRRVRAAARAGWGVAVARIVAVGAKAVAGAVILAVGVTALLIG